MLYASPVSFALVFAFDVCSLVLGHYALFGPVLTHSESELYTIYFFWIPYSVRNVLENFENCSQSAQPVGEPNQPVH